MPRLRLRTVACVVVLVVVAAIGGCGGASRLSTTGVQSGVLSVVAGENVWGDIAAQLGGSHVKVRSLITDPNADPHEFVADASDAASVASAAVVIENGAAYDPFMSQLVNGSGRHPVVVIAANIFGVRGADPNPHVWYGIEKVPAIASSITQAFSALEPAHRAVFAENLARFDRSLRPIEEVVMSIHAHRRGVAVAYTERVPGYLLGEAGLSNVTPLEFSRAIEEGTEPSASATAAMDALITDKKIRVLCYNSQTVDTVTSGVEALARSHRVPVVAFTETLPVNATYQSWQLGEARALGAALGVH